MKLRSLPSPTLHSSIPRLPIQQIAFVLLSLIGLGDAVIAHSFNRTFASARYAGQIDEERLSILIVVELPTLDVLGDFRRFLRDHPEASDGQNTERFRLEQLELMASSFALELNGVAIQDAWQPVENPANGLGDANFFVYMIEHRRPLTAGGLAAEQRLEVELSNRLQPAKVVFMSSRTESSDGWRVASDSSVALLADGLDGEVVGPDVAAQSSDKWSTDEAMRQLRVLFLRGDAALSE